MCRVLALLCRDFDSSPAVPHAARPVAWSVQRSSDNRRCKELDLCHFAGQFVESGGRRAVAGEKLVIEGIDRTGVIRPIDEDIGMILTAEETIDIVRPIRFVT